MENKKPNCKKQDKSINNKKEKHIKELEELKAENIKLKNSIEALNKDNALLKVQINKWEKDFIDKVKSKEAEAIKIIKQKEEEILVKNNEKLEDFKLKLFTKDILDLINTIDQFETIISSPVSNEIIQNYVNGFKMFLNMFENSLSSMGIKKINVKPGDKLDPNIMEATELVDSSTFEKDQVVEVIGNGYTFNNKVIKFIKVKVQK